MRVKWKLNTENTAWESINGVFDDKVKVGDAKVSFEYLIANYTQFNGEPCGVKVII